jgi:hypothetical protein
LFLRVVLPITIWAYYLNFSELKSRHGGLYFWNLSEKDVIDNGINMQAVASITLEMVKSPVQFFCVPPELFYTASKQKKNDG